MWDNQLTALLNRAQNGIDAILSPEAGDADNQQVNLRIELGRTRLPPDNVQELRSGSVVSLDGPVGEPATIYAGQRLVGRGKVVVVDGKIGVRLIEFIGLSCTVREKE